MIEFEMISEVTSFYPLPTLSTLPLLSSLQLQDFGWKKEIRKSLGSSILRWATNPHRPNIIHYIGLDFTTERNKSP